MSLTNKKGVSKISVAPYYIVDLIVREADKKIVRFGWSREASAALLPLALPGLQCSALHLRQIRILFSIRLPYLYSLSATILLTLFLDEMIGNCFFKIL